MKRKTTHHSIRSSFLGQKIFLFLFLPFLIFTTVVLVLSMQQQQLLGSRAFESDTIRLYPTKDSYVDKNKPTSSFGSNRLLSVRKGTEKVSYLSFNLSQVAASRVLSAKLRLKVCSESNCASTASQSIKKVTMDWTESQVSYQNHPTLGTVIGKLNGGTTNRWVEVNLTSAVKAQAGTSAFSIAIDQSSEDGIYFYSRENAADRQPYLLITHTGSTSSSPTTTPLSSATIRPTATSTPYSTPSPTTIPTVQPTSTSTPRPTTTATPVLVTPTPIPTLPPTPVPGNDPILFINGDVVSGSSVARAQKVATLIRTLMAQTPGRQMYVASTGDLEQENSPTLQNYQDNFGPTYGSFVTDGVFKPVRGNHDVQDAGHGLAFAQYFGQRIQYDAYGFTNFSYTMGNWHIIGLEQLNGSVNSRAMSFLQYDLASHSSYSCQLVYWHVPTYSSGASHGDSLGLKAINQVLYTAGVDLQFNGHDHHYQRFYPINSNGVRDDARGITTFIVGIAGQNGRSGSQTSAAQAASAKFLDQFVGKEAIGVVKLTLHSNSADYQLYEAHTGSVLDSGTINCH